MEADSPTGAPAVRVIDWATGAVESVAVERPVWHFVGNELVGPDGWISASNLANHSMTADARAFPDIGSNLISYGSGYKVDWFLTEDGITLVDPVGRSHVVNVGPELTNLTPPYQGPSLTHGAISPDERTIAFGITDRPVSHLTLVDTQTGQTNTWQVPQPVGVDPWGEVDPYYDASGKLFVTLVSHGHWFIYTLKGGKLQQFSPGSSTLYSSPDKRIVVDMITQFSADGQAAALIERFTVDGRAVVNDSKEDDLPIAFAVTGVLGGTFL